VATVFSHAVIPLTVYLTRSLSKFSPRLLWTGIFLSILPDADVISFKFGIPYSSPWGHRGFTHSLAFALLTGVVLLLFHRGLRSNPWNSFFIGFLSTLSHSVLDSVTNGGLGVAFLWPLTDERYFLPWRVIEVSPIGMRFFTSDGLEVIKSELLWIFFPSLLILLLIRSLRVGRKKRPN
jgi:inner membrane protein